MKISLRKANALQTTIQEAINEPFVGNVMISKYDNVDTVYNTASKVLEDTIEKKFCLIDVLYSIRKKVGEASASCGVAELLTNLANNEKTAAFAKQLAATPYPTIVKEQISKILTDLAEQKDSYGRIKDALNMSLLSKETIDSYKSTVNVLRRQKQTISDKLLNLNVSTEIELDENEITVLKKYDIL
jgi:hypothetical protein